MLQLKAISRPSRRAAAIGFRFAHLARPHSQYVGWQGLLAAGASVNEKDGLGVHSRCRSSPLHFAASGGGAAVARLLLLHGADVGTMSDNGCGCQSLTYIVRIGDVPVRATAPSRH